jgi:hypothetical protein
MGYLAKAPDMPQEEFEDTKGVIRISKSKKDIQYNHIMETYGRTAKMDATKKCTVAV